MLLAKQERALAWLMERYILRDPEAIYSKLAAKPALRRNILGLIASKVVNTVPELLSFFEKTFYGFQFEAVLLESKIREVIDLLIIWEMINPLDANETLTATPYGRRISHLYLDPETGASLAEGLVTSITQKEKKSHSIAFLDLIVGTPDMIELSFQKRDFRKTEERLKRFTPKLIKPVPDPLGIEYEFRLRDFKTVLFLWDWIREIPIEQIILRYNIGSGDIKRIVDTATWLISAISEIAELKGREDTRYKFFAKKARSLSERVTYGIKSDAVSLTRVKGIGRKRARVLLDHGIRDITQLTAITVPQLCKIPGFGTELAKSILDAAAQVSTTAIGDYTNGDIHDYVH
ncbi:MAG: helix-hairpin-helix domain-containing protein [Candidatus Hodarchaeota archaeon]